MLGGAQILTRRWQWEDKDDREVELLSSWNWMWQRTSWISIKTGPSQIHICCWKVFDLWDSLSHKSRFGSWWSSRELPAQVPQAKLLQQDGPCQSLSSREQGLCGRMPSYCSTPALTKIEGERKRVIYLIYCLHPSACMQLSIAFRKVPVAISPQSLIVLSLYVFMLKSAISFP